MIILYILFISFSPNKSILSKYSIFKGWIIFHCTYISHFFFHLYIDRQLDIFHILTIVNNDTVNIGVLILFHNTNFNSFDYPPRSRISDSYGSAIFIVLMTFHILFCSSCTILHFYQQCSSVPVYTLANTYYFLFFWLWPSKFVWGNISFWF